MKPALEMFTFGRFTIHLHGQEITPPPRHGEVLCKALLCQPHREAPFFWLADELWPEAEADQAMQYLYVASNAVRSTLPRGTLLTHRQMQSYQLVGQEQLWIDADAALDLLDQVQALGPTASEGLPLLEQAMGYFRRGTFLAGSEGTWVYARRRLLEAAWERALTWLVEAYRQQGQLPQAERLLSEALAQNPLNENLLCSLMQVLHEQGMTHQALSTYEELVRALRKVNKQPPQEITELYRRLQRAPRFLDLPQFLQAPPHPAGQEARQPSPLVAPEAESIMVPEENGGMAQQGEGMFLLPDRLPAIARVSRQQQVLDVLCAAPDASPDPQHLGAWLALGASDLAVLCEAGWTTEGVLDALRLLLQTIQDMPALIRQHLHHLSNATFMSGIPNSPGEALSSQDQGQLCLALGQSIGQSWKLFHTSKPSLTYALAQAQLTLVQRVHTLLSPAVRPFFYAALYQLMGASLYLLGRFEQAHQALEQSYLAGLQVGHAWQMAQCLSWQAYLWNGSGKLSYALDTIEQALRLISSQQEREGIRLRARLLALSAECLARLGDASGAYERLQASEALLPLLEEPHEEFDRAAWLQHAGICALYLHDYPLAIQQLQLAREQLPSSWLLRTIATAVPLVQALTSAREMERALEVIQQTTPLLLSVQAPTFTQPFVTYLEQEVLLHLPENEQSQRLAREAQQQLAMPRRGH